MKNNFFKSALLLLTTACPIECEHCQYFCTKEMDPDKWFTPKNLLLVKKKLVSLGVDRLKITGGEPLYKVELFFELLDILKSDTYSITLASSGFWGKDRELAKKIIKRLKKEGIKELEVSIDRFHLKRISSGAIENILAVAKEQDFSVILRPLLDQKSKAVVQQVRQLIIKYQPSILFCITSPHGRAECFKEELLGRHPFLEEALNIKIENSDCNNDQSREQRGDNKIRERGAPVTPTIMPNGNIFGCCVVGKGTFLGNLLTDSVVKIKQEGRDFLEKRFVKTGRCRDFLTILPKEEKNECRFCFDNPEKVPGLLVDDLFCGTRFLVLKPEDFLVKKIASFYNGRNGFLISLDWKNCVAGDCFWGEKILEEITKAREQKIPILINKPIPPCLFKTKFKSFKAYKTLLKKYQIPTGCDDCRSLVVLRNDKLLFCPEKINLRYPLTNKNGLPIGKDITRLVKGAKKLRRMAPVCEKCAYWKKKICNCPF